VVPLLNREKVKSFTRAPPQITRGTSYLPENLSLPFVFKRVVSCFEPSCLGRFATELFVVQVRAILKKVFKK